jgi:diguanylate cyclase (GGDEF)-like protein
MEDWLRFAASPVFGPDGELIASVATLTDMSEFKGLQEIIYFKATHDSLTGLPNAGIFTASLKKAFARAKREHSGGALLIIGVDKFKRVNETLGHTAGDELLRCLAKRISSEIRETDMVSRRADDEFCVLIADVNDEDDLHITGDIAERIRRAVCEAVIINGNEVYVTASIGISLFPVDAFDENTLFTKAAAALREVKKNGRNGWKFWKKPNPAE